jgi:hypothetical protein
MKKLRVVMFVFGLVGTSFGQGTRDAGDRSNRGVCRVVERVASSAGTHHTMERGTVKNMTEQQCKQIGGEHKAAPAARPAPAPAAPSRYPDPR